MKNKLDSFGISNATVQAGHASLMAYFRRDFGDHLRLAIQKIRWDVETHIRDISASVEAARLRIKDVFENYTLQESLATVSSYTIF